MTTILDKLKQKLQGAAGCNPDIQVHPACILKWLDDVKTKI